MAWSFRADRLFGSLRTVDDRVTRLLDVDSYEDVDVYGRADEATSALVALGDALVSAAPFPRATGSVDASGDDVVSAVLRERYVGGESIPMGDVSSVDRVVVHDDSVVVPLERTGPMARNWGPALAVLRGFVDDLLTRARTLVRRVRTVDVVHVRDACRAISGMLASVRDVLSRSRSGARFVDRRADNGADAPMAFASWASDTLTGGNDG
jgi:hypothetical protein